MALSIGQKVSSKKNGNGIIVKIITKSTGYVQVDFNGTLKNEMAFNLNDEFGNCLKSKPASKEPKELTAADIYNEKIESAKRFALSVNNKEIQANRYSIACEMFSKLQTNGNTFIESLLNSFFSKNFLSEKQAWHLAKFTVESNQF
jgi:hypothetical protein